VYVIKQISIMDLSPHEQSDAIREVHIMASMDSPYIVKYYDSFIDSGLLCIVMEFCDRGDVSRMVKKQASVSMPLPEDRVWLIFLQVALGLQYLHSKRTLHRVRDCTLPRPASPVQGEVGVGGGMECTPLSHDWHAQDLKSANVFLCSGDKVKIGDLGVARVLGNESFFAKTVCGTPYYLVSAHVRQSNDALHFPPPPSGSFSRAPVAGVGGRAALQRQVGCMGAGLRAV